MRKIKKWNWTLFVVVLCIFEISALTNTSITNTSAALLFGLIAAVLFGLPMAILTKDDN